MRGIILIIVFGAFLSCNGPLRVTGKTDVQSTTSGTMGSVKANNQMPALDTPVNKNPVPGSRP